MLKKVFLLILPIAFLVSYGCSSMKHSTIVLYVSHKVEGPLYMPKPEPPVETTNPQIEREKREKQASESKKPAKKNKEVKDNNQVMTNVYSDYQTRTLPRGEFLILDKPIRFAFEKYGIGSEYNDTIQYVANFMNKYTNLQLIVEGHTDRIGEYGYNKNLSLMRSRTAISKLVRAGVDRKRLIQSGVSYRFSEYNFNRLNRRVEFILIENPEEVTNYRAIIK